MDVRQMGDQIKRGLQYNKIIRAMAKPYKVFQERKLQSDYMSSPYPDRIKEFKGIHAGKSCFIIGNGPSLRASDLDRLQGIPTFAANRIYEIFDQCVWRPTYYISVDRPFIAKNYETILNQISSPIFLRYGQIKDRSVPDHIIGVNLGQRFSIDPWNDQGMEICEDVSNHFSEGSTVTFVSIQLAIYMGFTDIYLLGVDFSYALRIDEKGKVHRDASVQDYFSTQKHNTIPVFNYQANLRAYIAAKEYGDTHGISIRNATRGGKLEVFERVDFDEVIKKRTSQEELL